MMTVGAMIAEGLGGLDMDVPAGERERVMKDTATLAEGRAGRLKATLRRLRELGRAAEAALVLVGKLDRRLREDHFQQHVDAAQDDDADGAVGGRR
jgi:hypothetical protein